MGVPAEAPANTRPAAGGPRRPRGFAPAIPLPAGGIFQLYQRIYRLYQLDRSQVGPESRSPPRAGASGRRAGARASPASAHASARAATAGLDLGYPSWAPRVSAPVLRCLVSLSDKLNLVPFCKSPVFAQRSTSSGQTAGGGRACKQSVQVPRGPWGAPGDAVTWAEPQDLGLDSEGSYSSLRLSFVRRKMSWASIQRPSRVF